MNLFEKISNDVNAIKELHQELGDNLHDCINRASFSLFSKTEIVELMAKEVELLTSKDDDPSFVIEDAARLINDTAECYGNS